MTARTRLGTNNNGLIVAGFLMVICAAYVWLAEKVREKRESKAARHFDGKEAVEQSVVSSIQKARATMVTSESAGFIVDPRRQVDIFGGRKGVSLCEVPLGKEFIADGRRWQAVATPSSFGRVPAYCRFRSGDTWYQRDGCCNVGYAIVPNTHFGELSGHTKICNSVMRVLILEVIDRGSVE